MKLLLDTHIFLWYLSDDFDVLFPKQLEINGFEMLPIKIGHLSSLIALPFHHRDPFDRLLIGQTISENMQIVSIDEIFDSYKITRIIKIRC